MKKILIILFLVLLTLNTRCGSGGGDGGGSGSTFVTIVFGEVRTAPETTAELVSGKLNTHNVPGDRMTLTPVAGRQLTICRITITGPGMKDMVREIDIAGEEAISAAFNVKNGLNRYFLVEFIDNENSTLFSADRSGVNLDGRTLKIEVQAEPTDTYLAPPEFSGLSSISNAETRSVRLGWEPATDNLTPQDRLQYEIYLSNKSIAEREDIFTVFDTVYTLGNATVLEGDPLMSHMYDANNELVMITYDYEGAIPDEGTVSGVLHIVSLSERLKPGQPYYFIVKAKDEFGHLDDNFIESSSVTVYMFDVETEGSGTVTSEPAGINCGSNGSSCIEDYLSGTEVVLTAMHDEGGTFLGWSGDECSGTEDCIITLDDSRFVHARFCQIHTYYWDADADTYGDPDNSVQACVRPLDFIDNGSDCNDSNAAINPQADEVCDHADNDCDDQVDEGYDSDGDGYSTCGGDCDDSNALIHHGALEVCDDEIDNDCDGATDESDTNCKSCVPGATHSCNTGKQGLCAAGSETCNITGTWGACVQNVQPSAEICDDSSDNDCDGETDVIDTDCWECSPGNTHSCDTDQQGVCKGGTETCGDNGFWEACEQNVLPSSEICDDNLDNDCDGATDVIDTDCWECSPGETDSCNTGRLGVCEAGTVTCGDNGFWGGCVQNVQPYTEVCDKLDNDCDGQIDEIFTDLGSSCSVGTGECSATGTRICNASGTGTTCNATAGTESSEICDGLDNDCDGLTDEDYVTTPTNCGQGVCASSGQLECQDGGEVDTCIPGTPAPDDSVCNGQDDDCNGEADEDYVITATNCGVGECSASGQLECQDGGEVDTCSPLPEGTEGPGGHPTCSDKSDNDCDGATDVNDTDCIDVTGTWDVTYDWQCKKNNNHSVWNIYANGKWTSGDWILAGDQVTLSAPGITYVGTVTGNSISGTMSLGFPGAEPGCWTATKITNLY